jgi:hypothetical protein
VLQRLDGLMGEEMFEEVDSNDLVSMILGIREFRYIAL